MTSIRKAIIFGFLVWAIPFAVAFMIFGIRESNRPLFESMMPVVLTGCAVLFSVLYFKKADKTSTTEGLKLGLIWLVISLIIDLGMFMQGPMKMPLVDYIADIGFTYLIIPIITVGSACLRQKQTKE
jgi:ABC-type tungstate transport system substrate-binding protein